MIDKKVVLSAIFSACGVMLFSFGVYQDFNCKHWYSLGFTIIGALVGFFCFVLTMLYVENA